MAFLDRRQFDDAMTPSGGFLLMGQSVRRGGGSTGHLFDSVEHAVIATDLDGLITYWNHAAEQIYGWTGKEVLGRHIVDIVSAASQTDRANQILERLCRGEIWGGEFPVRRRDGSEFTALVINAPIIRDGTLIGILGASIPATASAPHQQQDAPLSRREQQVLPLAAEGKTNKEIAAQLGVSRRTVETQRANLSRKLGFRTRTDLIVHALRRGILKLEESSH